MGVKRLQTYVEKICSEGEVCRRVNIRDMADLHRLAISSPPDERPVLLVDGVNIIFHIYMKSLDWVCGGQWAEAVVLLRRFVERFDTAGIGLLFMFDGPVCREKRPEWCTRRTDKMKEVEDLFMCLKRTGRPPPSDLVCYSFSPTSSSTFLRFALKLCCDANVRVSIREADIEIAEYAKKDDKVFAILAQDSDFLIFDTKPYLSVKHLNLDDLTTLSYDRQRLASKLSLSVEHLPLLACLVGNDIIPPQSLKTFHRKICWTADRTSCDVRKSPFGTGGIRDVMPLVAGVINAKKWKGDYRNNKELDDICVEVFGDTRDVELLRRGIKFYCLLLSEKSPTSSGCWSVAFDRHVSGENFPTVYGLLNNCECNVAEVLEDYADKSLPPANLTYRPIMQRAYFVLFQGKVSGVSVKEWCAVPRRGLFEPELVPPMPLETLEGTLPSLERLWCGEEKDDRDARFRCFYACLGGCLKQKYLSTILPKYTILCCVLHYLLSYGHERRPLLAPWEVSAFIVQAIYPQDPDLRCTKSNEIMEDAAVDTRAVHLASLFMRGVSALSTVMCICGYPLPLVQCMPWNFFDGKLFQSVYLRAKNGATIEELCDFEVKLIEEFYDVLCVVTFGTALANARLFRGRW